MTNPSYPVDMEKSGVCKDKHNFILIFAQNINNGLRKNRHCREVLTIIKIKYLEQKTNITIFI